MSRSPSKGRARAAAAALLCVAVSTLSGCAGLRQALSPAPKGAPSGRDGWLVYSVRAFRFEAPAAWRASGGDQHVKLEAPDGTAWFEISTPGTSYADEKACLAGAEEFLKRGAELERVRRHPTRLAGVPAVTLEGDSGGWHVWAYAACDGGTQYQLFFTARTPAPAEAVEAYRTLVQSAKVGGQA
jgi:hypothetical protein